MEAVDRFAAVRECLVARGFDTFSALYPEDESEAPPYMVELQVFPLPLPADMHPGVAIAREFAVVTEEAEVLDAWADCAERILAGLPD